MKTKYAIIAITFACGLSKAQIPKTLSNKMVKDIERVQKDREGKEHKDIKVHDFSADSLNVYVIDGSFESDTLFSGVITEYKFEKENKKISGKNWESSLQITYYTPCTNIDHKPRHIKQKNPTGECIWGKPISVSLRTEDVKLEKSE